MMPIQWHGARAWIDRELAGMVDPWVFMLVLATLLPEDLAIAAGVALVAQGTISLALSVVAAGGGIASDDLGLYALGMAATRVPSRP